MMMTNDKQRLPPIVVVTKELPRCPEDLEPVEILHQALAEAGIPLEPGE